MKTSFIAAASALSLFVSAIGLNASENRTWTSSDGERSFEGRLRSYSPDTGQVTVILDNGRPLSFAEEALSADDRKYLAEAKTEGGSEPGSSASANSVLGEQV